MLKITCRNPTLPQIQIKLPGKQSELWPPAGYNILVSRAAPKKQTRIETYVIIFSAKGPQIEVNGLKTGTRSLQGPQ